MVTLAGIDRRDSDFFRGIVTNSVLDGYSGRLNQEIRIKRGLSYGAGSSLEARREVGPFVASAQTQNEAGAQQTGTLGLTAEIQGMLCERIAEQAITNGFTTVIFLNDHGGGTVVYHSRHSSPSAAARRRSASCSRTSGSSVAYRPSSVTGSTNGTLASRSGHERHALE